MTRAIDSVPAVQHTEVSYSLQRAYVDSDRCTPDVFEAISKALFREGYGGTVISIEARAPDVAADGDPDLTPPPERR